MVKKTRRDNIVSLLFFIWVLGIPMIFTLPFLALGLLMKGIGLKRFGNRFIYHCVNIWSKYIYKTAGGKLTVKGIENVPEKENICFISNHQGVFDILIILSAMPMRVGFIAKKSLMRLPIFAQWMYAIGCIFIDRSSAKNARNTINKGIANIKKGNSLVIFPEGTRSRGPELGEFKKGSIKLALKSNATIVPITINGTYKMYEERKCLNKADMFLHIHKPIRPDDITPERTAVLMDEIREIIASGLME